MDINEWVATLEKEIASPNDKPIFEEITGCLKAGFYRSAYIMSWVAIAENLKGKILELSNIGDKQAEAAIKQIQELEAKRLSVDKTILDEAKKINLIDDQDSINLEYLWSQRCVYAHPYNHAPTEEQTKYIVSYLVSICLSKPLLFKKGFLEDMVNSLVTLPHFISNDREKITAYFGSILPRVTKDLHPFLFKTLHFELGKIVDDETKSDVRFKLRMFIISLLETTEVPLSESVWGLEDRAIKYAYTTFYGTINIPVWQKLPTRIKDILIDYAVGETTEPKFSTIKSFLSSMITHTALEQPYKTKFFERLDRLSYTNAINFYATPEKMLERTISELDTNQYHLQNPVFEFIREENGQAFLKKLNTQEQLLMGGKLMYAVKSGNWSGISYFNNLPGTAKVTLQVALGMFRATIINRASDFNLNLDYFFTAGKLLNDFEEADLVAGVDIIIAEVNLMEGKTHNTNEAVIDAVKVKIGDFKPALKNSLEQLLDVLKKFEYKFDL